MTLQPHTTPDEETGLTVYQPPSGPLAPTITGIVRPLVSPQAAQQAVRDYELLKSAIARPEDQVTISGRPFLKKSFWRRIAAMFGVSLELVGEEYLLDEATGVFGYSVMYRAIAPNGQSCVADGMCMSDEKRDQRSGANQPRTRHVVRATAHTRAKNRAISDLVGGGEVSAEEMLDDDDPNTVDATPVTRQNQQSAQQSRPTRSTQPPTAYDPRRDAELRKRLTALGHRTVEQVEAFVARETPGGHAPNKATLLARVAQIEQANYRTAPADEGTEGNALGASVDVEEHDLSTMFGTRGE